MRKSLTITLLACIAAAAPATAQVGPDVATSAIGGGNDFHWYGDTANKKAFSWATTSCNVGNQLIEWISGNSHQHPVIAQNMFRVANNRIEHLGYSFLKHSFCAVSEPTCGNCQATNCNTLGIGCADTYWATLNDGRDGGSKRDINGLTGFHNAESGPTGGTHRGRLLVNKTEWNNAGAQYIAETQYVSEMDQSAGLGVNNASWVPLNTSLNGMTAAGPIRMFEPGIFAWQEFDTGVTITQITNTQEGGTGSHGDVNGYYFLGSKVFSLGGGLWRYEYALQNLTSDQGARSFKISGDATCGVSDIFFRDVDAHSGDPWSTVDWAVSQTVGGIEWSTETFAQNANANAIRWGELYNFGFTSTHSPTNGTVDIGMFKPGVSTTLNTTVKVPNATCGGCTGSIANYCSATNNSTGGAASISASGSTSIAANNLTLLATGMPVGQFGYFLMADSQGFMPNLGGDSGNLCLGLPLVRFNAFIAPVDANGELTLTPDMTNLPNNTVFQPGDQWNFQAWFRDVGGDSNTSDGVAVDLCP